MTIKQNSQLTFKGNLGMGRHGWLRLTPAYSVGLVRESLVGMESGARIIDPFSGSGTTGLCAAEQGLEATLVDVNPFLVWFAEAKTRRYTEDEISSATALREEIIARAPDYGFGKNLWQPPIFNIERWWPPGELAGLKSIQAILEEHRGQSPSGRASGLDLLLVAFCRTLIAVSGAAFNHQSMSFEEASTEPSLFDFEKDTSVFGRFAVESEHIISTAQAPAPGSASVHLGDSRDLKSLPDSGYDALYTSPPYANRMSYIRELRPYMYWLGFLDEAREAGELDWQAIGGTWGVATSRLTKWKPSTEVPLEPELSETISEISSFQAKNGPLLARYVHKYFHDMWLHFQAAHRILKPGGEAIYVVGNSIFFGVHVPTEKWYAELMRHAGFEEIGIEKIRKRNSKKGLFEYKVTGRTQ